MNRRLHYCEEQITKRADGTRTVHARHWLFGKLVREGTKTYRTDLGFLILHEHRTTIILALVVILALIGAAL